MKYVDLGYIIVTLLFIVQVFVIDNCIDDWRIAISWRTLVQIATELIACSIHPIPGSFYFDWTTIHADGETITTARVPLDLALSIPMFLRLYLVIRGPFILLTTYRLSEFLRRHISRYPLFWV